jgi:hypothetical protein
MAAPKCPHGALPQVHEIRTPPVRSTVPNTWREPDSESLTVAEKPSTRGVTVSTPPAPRTRSVSAAARSPMRLVTVWLRSASRRCRKVLDREARLRFCFLAMGQDGCHRGRARVNGELFGRY